MYEAGQVPASSNRTSAGLAREADIDGILAINRLEYGPNDVLATRGDFAWRHQGNPAGPAIVPVVRDAQGKVVAFISVLPLRVRVTGRDHLAATGTNLVVHPGYRGTLVYTQLIRRFRRVLGAQAIPFHYSFVSEETYRRQRAHDPESVATVPLLFTPIDRTALIQSVFQRGWQRHLANGILSLAAPLFLLRRIPVSPEDVTLRNVATFGPEFDAFWPTVRDKYTVMVIRDGDFLSWRFAPISGRRYHILTAHAGGQMLGYAVLACSTIRGIQTGLVMDMLVNDGAQGESAGAQLLAAAERYFRTQKLSVAAALMMPTTAEYHILRRKGYVRIPERLAPRVFRFSVFTDSADGEVSRRLAASNWFVTLADYESF